MSDWLAERKCHYFFKCASGHTSVITATVADQDLYWQKSAPCGEEGCGLDAQYEFSEVDKADRLKQKAIVSYDHNGRKAYRITNPDGSHSHISATKMHYKKTGRIESQYTKAYQERLDKEKAELAARQKHENAKKGSTEQIFREMVKDMPDGEYLSDGESVKQIK